MKRVIVELHKGYEKSYPFENDEHMLFLGEIEDMPGHCAVVNRSGKVFWGYHTDNFRDLTELEK